MIIEEIPIFSYIGNELIHEIQSLFLMRAISSCVGRVLFWNILMMWDWKKEEKKSREHTAIVLAVMNASRDSGDQRVWPLIYRQDGQDTSLHTARTVVSISPGPHHNLYPFQWIQLTSLPVKIQFNTLKWFDSLLRGLRDWGSKWCTNSALQMTKLQIIQLIWVLGRPWVGARL